MIELESSLDGLNTPLEMVEGLEHSKEIKSNFQYEENEKKDWIFVKNLQNNLSGAPK